MRSNQTLKYFRVFVNRIPQLTGREKEVLTKRLKKIPLEDIGKPLDLTEGRIRQIEKVAINKIKQKSQQLALFK